MNEHGSAQTVAILSTSFSNAGTSASSASSLPRRRFSAVPDGLLFVRGGVSGGHGLPSRCPSAHHRDSTCEEEGERGQPTIDATIMRSHGVDVAQFFGAAREAHLAIGASRARDRPRPAPLEVLLAATTCKLSRAPSIPLHSPAARALEGPARP